MKIKTSRKQRRVTDRQTGLRESQSFSRVTFPEQRIQRATTKQSQSPKRLVSCKPKNPKKNPQNKSQSIKSLNKIILPSNRKQKKKENNQICKNQTTRQRARACERIICHTTRNVYGPAAARARRLAGTLRSKNNPKRPRGNGVSPPKIAKLSAARTEKFADNKKLSRFGQRCDVFCRAVFEISAKVRPRIVGRASSGDSVTVHGGRDRRRRAAALGTVAAENPAERLGEAPSEKRPIARNRAGRRQ